MKTDNVASDESENEEKAENSQVMLDYDEEDDNFDVSPEEEQVSSRALFFFGKCPFSLKIISFSSHWTSQRYLLG